MLNKFLFFVILDELKEYFKNFKMIFYKLFEVS